MNIPEQRPADYDHRDILTPTESLTQKLLKNGALPVNRLFEISSPGQGEVIFNNRRFLLTPNDVAYRKYAKAMHLAGVPYLQKTPFLSTDEVVVGEIPRDARLMTQVMFGRQPEEGPTRNDAIKMIGRAAGRVINMSGMAPSEISLRKTLILRLQQEAMFVPPVLLEEADEHSVERISTEMEHALAPYARFGAVAMMDAFNQGIRP